MGFTSQYASSSPVFLVDLLIIRLSTFLSSSTTLFPTTSILPFLIKALEEDEIPTPSPIAIEAVIGGIISQTIVATITGQSELKDGIEFDATTLNATEFVYCSVCLKK